MSGKPTNRPKNEALWKLRANHAQCFLENDVPALAVRASAGLIDCWAGGGKWSGTWWMFRRAVEGSIAKARVAFYVWRYRLTGYDPERLFAMEADDE